MTQQKIELIVCDIEGCIMPSNRGICRPADLEVLSHYCAQVRQGAPYPPLILCTGRQAPYAEAVTQLIGAFFPGFFSIVENGAFLYDVASNDIGPHPLLTSEYHQMLMEVRTHTDELIRQHKARKEYGKEVCISLNPPKNMDINEWFLIVRESLTPWKETLNVTHSASAVDITPFGIDKAAGLRAVSERLGIAFGAMLGVGDTRGDLPMLKLVGVPTGPANATNEIRQIAVYISPAVGPTGVVQIIEKYTGWSAGR
jgi:hydroxymethylpyrimidine pyrophosphatase-like HAD family hydrolase